MYSFLYNSYQFSKTIVDLSFFLKTISYYVYSFLSLVLLKPSWPRKYYDVQFPIESVCEFFGGKLELSNRVGFKFRKKKVSREDFSSLRVCTPLTFLRTIQRVATSSGDVRDALISCVSSAVYSPPMNGRLISWQYISLCPAPPWAPGGPWLPHAQECPLSPFLPDL